MRKNSVRLSLASLLAALLLITSTPAMAVYAEDGSSRGGHDGGDSSTTTSTPLDDSNTSSGTNENTSTTTNRETENENETTSHSASDQKSRAQAGKRRACQNREHAINNILGRIADRGQKQLNLFTTIATRVEAFYVAKGKTLSNYDTLVADVNAKHAAAQTTVNTIKATGVNFSCNGSDPKGAATSFKDSLKAEIAALKAYKTAVKNLIVGVKSVQSTTTTETEQNTGGNQ